MVGFGGGFRQAGGLDGDAGVFGEGFFQDGDGLAFGFVGAGAGRAVGDKGGGGDAAAAFNGGGGSDGLDLGDIVQETGQALERIDVGIAEIVCLVGGGALGGFGPDEDGDGLVAGTEIEGG